MKPSLTSGEFWLLVHIGLAIAFIHSFAVGLGTLLRPATSRLTGVVRTVSTSTLAPWRG